MNNPVAEPNEIPGLVQKGYLVRTMTDGGAAAVRANDGKRRDAALAGGAQLLSTDYPLGEKAASGYSVGFEKGFVRCNPVVKAAACSEAALAEPPVK
jgi:hypothetical protein